MRTIGKTRHYCAHCGFDLPNGDEDHSIMCPACDGDICKPKRRVVADAPKPVRPSPGKRDMNLKPFWRYYGGKFRAAPRYPAPAHRTIIEPFAGAAGYALRYPDRDVILVERYPVVAGIWRYLITVSEDEIRRIPPVDAVADLPSWVPQEARDLVGFCMNSAVTSPRKTLSAGWKELRAQGRRCVGWSVEQRERVASQLASIRHWQVVEGDYRRAPLVEATWFVDPPYHYDGLHYVYAVVDYTALGRWCRELPGQVIVCEQEGAGWLPFRPFMSAKSSPAKRVSREVIWTNAAE